MTKKTKAAFIVRNFRDAGTTQRFTKGAIEQIDEGAFLNHQRAGLVREPTAEEMKAARADEGKASASSVSSAATGGSAVV